MDQCRLALRVTENQILVQRLLPQRKMPALDRIQRFGLCARASPASQLSISLICEGDFTEINRRNRNGTQNPRITLSVEKTDSGWLVGGREVDERFVTVLGGGFFPSYEYIRRVMEKVHKYLEVAPHACGMRGKDCRLCQAGKPA